MEAKTSHLCDRECFNAVNQDDVRVCGRDTNKKISGVIKGKKLKSVRPHKNKSSTDLGKIAYLTDTNRTPALHVIT
jgi:hypothetical protein